MLSDGKYAPYRSVRGSHTVCLWVVGQPSGDTKLTVGWGVVGTFIVSSLMQLFSLR
jgi:hypothetical protein